MTAKLSTSSTIPGHYAGEYGFRSDVSIRKELAFLLDRSGCIVSWSPADLAAMGFAGNEVLGKHCWEVLRGSDTFGRPLPCDECRRSADTGRPWRARTAFILTGRDGIQQKFVHELLPLPGGPQGQSLVILREPSQCIAKETGPFSGQSPPGAHPSAYWNTVRQLASLGIVSSRLNTVDTAATIDVTLEQVLRGTGAEVAELFLLHRTGNEMILAAHQGLFQNAFYQISRFNHGEGFPGLVASSGEPLVTKELSTDTRFLRTRVKAKGFQVYACVPLRTHNGIAGSLNIASRNRDLDIASQIQFLTWITNPLGMALESARLRQEQAIRSYHCEPNEEDSAEDEEGEDCELVRSLRALVELGQARAGKLALVDTSNEVLVRQVGYPASCGTGCSCEFSSIDGCPAFRSCRPLILTRGQPLPGVACRGVLDAYPSALCLPLSVSGKPMGAVTLAYQEGYELVLRRLALLGGAESMVASAAWPAYRKRLAARRERPAVYRPEIAAGPIPKGNVPYLDIHCLGVFRVYKRGILLTVKEFERRSAIAVLKVLVAHRGKSVSQDRLIECIWPEADPDRARSSLWVAIHSLRRALEEGPGKGPTVVLTDGDAYRFNTSISHRTDLDTLLTGMRLGEESESGGDQDRALAIYRTAVQAYGGDLLEGDDHCGWCAAEREYLRESYLSLLRRMTRLHEDRGCYEQAVLFCRQALAKDPLREEIQRHLMSCLWRAGRKDEALRQYRECRQLLAQDLAVEPMEETTALYRRIRNS